MKTPVLPATGINRFQIVLTNMVPGSRFGKVLVLVAELMLCATAPAADIVWTNLAGTGDDGKHQWHLALLRHDGYEFNAPNLSCAATTVEPPPL